MKIRENKEGEHIGGSDMIEWIGRNRELIAILPLLIVTIVYECGVDYFSKTKSPKSN